MESIAGVIFALLIVGYIVIIARKRSLARNPSYIGKQGENRVASILRSLPKKYLTINNVIIPTEDSTTQIDHVVVSPFGIFVIETKNYSGWISGTEKGKRWKESFKTTKGNYFYNPIRQNWVHTYALAKHLDLSIHAFKPIVVFSDNCELNVESSVPVIYMSQLKRVIQSYHQEIIPRKECPLLFNKLSRINLTGEENENNHIQSVRLSLIEKEIAVEEEKCPICGGSLILRSGKYGEFYGCSNYPKCRFTYNGHSE